MALGANIVEDRPAQRMRPEHQHAVGSAQRTHTREREHKGVAHRAQNPGGQNAHTVLALLGQQDASSRDLHADRRAVEQPTAAL